MDRTDARRFSAPVRELYNKISPCTLCPRNCRAERLAGRTGYCGLPASPRIASFGPHFGEESVLVGRGGSGTIFFSGCNMACCFCQNYDISHLRTGSDTTVDALADTMLALQQRGCSNINLVTPTHFAAPIAAAIELARAGGLSLPIVYNTGGYDSVETLHLLEGFVQIYMPDMKYADAKVSVELSDAPDYPAVNRAAVREMHRQVGDLHVKDGLATRGLLVRHLVLPSHLAGSLATLKFLAEEISSKTAVNVMDQYRPCWKASTAPAINRRPTADEIRRVVDCAASLGLGIIS
jgi:putative pyruvate formate lyase activating enzyme